MSQLSHDPTHHLVIMNKFVVILKNDTCTLDKFISELFTERDCCAMGPVTVNIITIYRVLIPRKAEDG